MPDNEWAERAADEIVSCSGIDPFPDCHIDFPDVKEIILRHAPLFPVHEAQKKEIAVLEKALEISVITSIRGEFAEKEYYVKDAVEHYKKLAREEVGE